MHHMFMAKEIHFSHCCLFVIPSTMQCTDSGSEVSEQMSPALRSIQEYNQHTGFIHPSLGGDVETVVLEDRFV